MQIGFTESTEHVKSGGGWVMGRKIGMQETGESKEQLVIVLDG